MSYTTCRIGGVDVFIDPDNIAESVTPFGSVVPSLDGTMFLKYLATNPANIGSMDRITVSGVYLETDPVTELKTLARTRTPVKVVGVPGIDATDNYFITEMQHAPIKPAVVFPGDSWDTPPVRHSYNLQLSKINSY